MFDVDHLRFKHPFTALVAGPTGSGKTVLVRHFLSQHEHTIAPDIGGKLNVLWCFGQWQDLYSVPLDDRVTLNYHEGLPSREQLAETRPTVVVIDDLMTELAGDKAMTNLFTKGSHHLKISVIFIVQNMFYNAKEMRTINVNTSYFVLLKNPRDKTQVENLGKQMFPGKKQFLRDAFVAATSKPYGYIIVDCKSDTPDILRVRTRVLPSEHIKGLFRPLVYTPK